MKGKFQLIYIGDNEVYSAYPEKESNRELLDTMVKSRFFGDKIIVDRNAMGRIKGGKDD